ncbi:MAG: hypothetical protein A3F88_07935 [Deltaproteobacteria bacterium RIFCSPLOWO2_12_FULL_42_16]|nr:MAG: hypothetical protein A3F88_07935 [Deltaproteobacteria bacterium RIFCSPLOWO2_12_FULL_42_16]
MKAKFRLMAAYVIRVIGIILAIKNASVAAEEPNFMASRRFNKKLKLMEIALIISTCIDGFINIYHYQI